MRTTVNIDDALLRRAKQLAARTGRSLTQVVDDALRAALDQRAQPRARLPVTVFHGDGLQPGVDLDDSAALLDVMDPPDAAR